MWWAVLWAALACDAASAEAEAGAEQAWEYYDAQAAAAVAATLDQVVERAEAGLLKAWTPVRPVSEGGAWRPAGKEATFRGAVAAADADDYSECLYYMYDTSTEEVTPARGRAAVEEGVAVREIFATTVMVRYYETAWAPFSTFAEFGQADVARVGEGEEGAEAKYYHVHDGMASPGLYRGEIQHLIRQGFLAPASLGYVGAAAPPVGDALWVPLVELTEGGFEFRDASADAAAAAAAEGAGYFYYDVEEEAVSAALGRAELAGLIKAGDVPGDALVARAGDTAWKKAWAFPELFEETYVAWRPDTAEHSPGMAHGQVQELIDLGLLGPETFFAKMGAAEWTPLREYEQFILRSDDDDGEDEDEDEDEAGELYIFKDAEHGVSVVPMALAEIQRFEASGRRVTAETKVKPVGGEDSEWKPLKDVVAGQAAAAGDGGGDKDDGIQPEVHRVTDADYEKLVKDGRYWLLAGTIPTCGFCKQLFPELAQLGEKVTREHKRFAVGQLNGNTEQATMKQYGIDAYPNIWIMTPAGDRIEYTNHRHRTAEKLYRWLQDVAAGEEEGEL